MTMMLALWMGLGASAAQADTGSVWGTLTPAQQSKLKEGKQVQLEVSEAGAPWPKIVYIDRIENSDAEGAASVFWDLSDHPNYLRDQGLKDQVVLSRSGNSQTCRATVPFFDGTQWRDWQYTAEVTGRKDCGEAGCVYTVAWRSIQGGFLPSIDFVESSLVFTPFPAGRGALMEYSMSLKPAAAVHADPALDAKVRSQIFGYFGTIVQAHATRMEQGPTYGERADFEKALSGFYLR